MLINQKAVVFITIYYDDLDNITSDLIELSEKVYNKCGELKKVNEGEQSIQYDLLEKYFYDLNKFLKDNKNTILCNLVNIPGIELSQKNMFKKSG